MCINSYLIKLYRRFFINIILATIVIIAYSHSYAGEDKTKSTIEVKSHEIYTEHAGKFQDSITCFKKGIKDCIDFVFPVSFSLIIVIILAEQKLISYDGIKSTSLINICADNITNFVFYSFIFPIFENILSHSIGYSYTEKLFNAIVPTNFSNERLNKKIATLKDYNLPLINDKINNLCARVDQESKINPKSTSMTVELLSKLVLAYTYFKIHVFNQQIVSGIVKTKHAIYRTEHYKHKGYHGAVMYQSGFTACMYLCIAVILMGAYLINS